MARTAVSVQDVAIDGLNPTYTAAIADGHMFTAEAGTILHVKNTDGSPHNVTVPTPGQADGDLAIGDRTVQIPAGDDIFIGPFTASRIRLYKQSDGNIWVDYDVVTGMSIAVLRA